MAKVVTLKTDIGDITFYGDGIPAALRGRKLDEIKLGSHTIETYADRFQEPTGGD